MLMTDRENVIRELETLGAWHTHHYAPFHYEAAETIHDAIALLREQEPQETHLVHRYSRPGVYADLWLHCEVCGGKVDDNTHPKFCPNCGRKVK